MKTSMTQVEQTSSLNGSKMFFPEGIIGFETHKEYRIVSEKSKEPFFWLQSQKDSEINFIIIDPLEFKPDYKPVLSALDISALQINDIEECQCYVIVCVPQGVDQISANLLAPVMINKQKNICRQVVLQEQDYSIQHLVLDEMLKKIEDKNVSSFAQAK
ncbi:MAG: flagellar assembly protein FliW [Candidatus Omnitrophica bacterium]|nr:flagellar assembly protein FliW [Candidatus Omnitrophota bacterium]